MAQEEHNTENGKSNSEQLIAIQVGSVKKGGYCMLKGFPCQVIQLSTKPSKHGSAKATIVGVDIFTNKKYEETLSTGATIYYPNITKQQLEVADIDFDDNFVSCILPNGDLRTDLKMPVADQEIYKQLKNIWDNRGDDTVMFTIFKAVGQAKIISATTVSV